MAGLDERGGGGFAGVGAGGVRELGAELIGKLGGGLHGAGADAGVAEAAGNGAGALEVGPEVEPVVVGGHALFDGCPPRSESIGLLGRHVNVEAEDAVAVAVAVGLIGNRLERGIGGG